jgi:hypothetical protein
MRCVRLFVFVSLSFGLLVSQAKSAPRGDSLRYPGEERQVSYDEYDSSDDRDHRRADRDDHDHDADRHADAEHGRRSRREADSDRDERRNSDRERRHHRDADFDREDRDERHEADFAEYSEYAPQRADEEAPTPPDDSSEPATLREGDAPADIDRREAAVRRELIDAGLETLGSPLDSCGDDCCDDSCDKCDWLGKCCRTPWRWCGLYADFLYLQPRNASVPFAVPQSGIGFAGSAPNGPAGSVVPVYRPGFRVGGSILIGPASRLTASYTWYENHTGANLTASPGGVLRPLTMFPGTFNAGFTAERASAAHDLDFQLADGNYEALFINCDRRWIGLMAGGVYGQLQQDFWANYPFNPPNGTTRVESHVDFHGAGIQLGLEGEQRVWRDHGFCVYGRGMSRFMCGQFRSRYTQTNEFNGIEATTSIKDARIVPLLDLEIGVSWISPKAGLRLYGGYMVNSWFNMVSTPAWHGAVQNSTFLPGSRSITFDGLVARAQISF